jgi:AcrR family transcriptional regulator
MVATEATGRSTSAAAAPAAAATAASSPGASGLPDSAASSPAAAASAASGPAASGPVASNPAAAAETASAEATAKERLLAAAMDHVAANGINNLSLRQLAAAIGTSHRMLVYHFSSKRGLVVDMVRTVERRQREALAELRRDLDAGTPESAAELGQRFWQRLTAPALETQERLFFEIYGHALQGDPACAPFLDEVVSAWLVTITELMRRLGVPEAEASAQARIALAVTRGLLLDLLTTGDRDGTTAAMNAFLATYDAPRVDATSGTASTDAAGGPDPSSTDAAGGTDVSSGDEGSAAALAAE